MSSLRESVAEEVRVLLARRRMTASALARQIDRSQSYMSRRLTGETAFDVDDLEAIAAVFGVTPVSLITGER
jgi:transcriptional regulator with XRE-family HTH domain